MLHLHLEDLNKLLMLNIAVIYEYGSEVWSSPHSIIEELRSRGNIVNRYHLSQMSKDDKQSKESEGYEGNSREEIKIIRGVSRKKRK